jgi:hypothetical protein
MQKVATACHLIVLAVKHGECQPNDGTGNEYVDNMNDSEMQRISSHFHCVNESFFVLELIWLNSHMLMD